MLKNVAVVIRYNGKIKFGYVIKEISYDACDGLEAALKAQYPDCVVEIQEMDCNWFASW